MVDVHMSLSKLHSAVVEVRARARHNLRSKLALRLLRWEDLLVSPVAAALLRALQIERAHASELAAARAQRVGGSDGDGGDGGNDDAELDVRLSPRLPPKPDLRADDVSLMAN